MDSKSFNWNGQVYMQPNIELKPFAEVVKKLVNDAHNQGIEIGLNINENQLAQEVKRLRAIMRQVANELRHYNFDATNEKKLSIINRLENAVIN